MTQEPTADKPKFSCHARRHMTGPVFKTYDAIMAMAMSAFSGTDEDGKPKKRVPTDVLSFYGKVRTLVNHTGTSKTQIEEHIETLVEDGWLIRCEPPDGGDRERFEGKYKSVVYIVLDHADYIAAGGHACPPFKYKEDGSPTVPKTQPIEFRIAELMKHAAGKIALALTVQKIPAKDFKGIVDYFRQHPDELPTRTKPGIPGKDE
jgi:hypothetical protein